MAFTQEDGTGVTGANSYVSIAEADTYWLTDRNNDATWIASYTAQKQEVLIKATEYLDASVRSLKGGWVGTKKTQDQGLDWPRYDATDENGFPLSSTAVPQRVKDAVFVLAKAALSAELLPSQDRGNAIKLERSKVGSLEKETEYFDWAPSQKTYDLVWRLVSGIVRGGGPTRELLRA